MARTNKPIQKKINKNFIEVIDESTEQKVEGIIKNYRWWIISVFALIVAFMAIIELTIREMDIAELAEEDVIISIINKGEATPKDIQGLTNFNKLRVMELISNKDGQYEKSLSTLDSVFEQDELSSIVAERVATKLMNSNSTKQAKEYLESKEGIDTSIILFMKAEIELEQKIKDISSIIKMYQKAHKVAKTESFKKIIKAKIITLNKEEGEQ